MGFGCEAAHAEREYAFEAVDEVAVVFEFGGEFVDALFEPPPFEVVGVVH